MKLVVKDSILFTLPVEKIAIILLIVSLKVPVKLRAEEIQQPL